MMRIPSIRLKSPIATRHKEPGFFMVTSPLNADNADNRFPAYITTQKNEIGGPGQLFPDISFFFARSALIESRVGCHPGRPRFRWISMVDGRLPSALAGPDRHPGCVPQLQDLAAFFHFPGDNGGLPFIGDPGAGDFHLIPGGKGHALFLHVPAGPQVDRDRLFFGLQGKMHPIRHSLPGGEFVHAHHFAAEGFYGFRIIHPAVRIAGAPTAALAASRPHAGLGPGRRGGQDQGEDTDQADKPTEFLHGAFLLKLVGYGKAVMIPS